MSTATIPITNFTAGEWSPRLHGRVDIQKYGQACSELVNLTLMPHGPVTRRMGTYFVTQAAHPSARLIEFIFNVEQAYVLEITPGKIRFFRDGGYLSGKDITTPYSEADIRLLSFCQAADLMYLVCPNVAPQKLTRPGEDTFTIAAVSFTATPSDWKAQNWPACATFYQQRLWFAGCPKQPNKIWASKTGDFQNFTTGTAEDAALSLSLVSEQVNAARWLLAQKVLVAGTSGGEWLLHGGDAALTNKNLAAKLNSNYGTARIKPLIIGAASAHVSADGRRLQSFFYDYGSDSYVSQELSLLAEHMTRPGIRAIANAQNPDGIIWCVMNDGSMAGCTWLKDQDVIGWHRFETRGMIRSVCCIPEESHTQTWLVVERQNGVFIECMAAPWDGETTKEPGCFYVDSGLVYEGAPVSTVSGLDHLEGLEVNILADGAEHPRRIVQGGAVHLEDPASLVLVGLPYAWRLAPMKLEGFSPRGTVQGKKVLVSKMTVRLYKTLGIMWRRLGSFVDKAWEVTFRKSEGYMDNPPLPYTGDVVLDMPGGWHEDSRVRLFNDGAFPATLIMMIPQATVNA